MSQNPNYNTMPSAPTHGYQPEAGGGVYRIVMPPGGMMRQDTGGQQVIHIGPSGMRTVSCGSAVPQVRVMERQPSGQFRIIGGTPGGVRVMESPYSGVRMVPGAGQAQEVRVMSGGGPQVINLPTSQPGGQPSGSYRIRFVPGEEPTVAPSSPQIQISGGGWPATTSQRVMFTQTPQAETPAQYHTISHVARTTDSPDARYRGQFQYPAHLVNPGRSGSPEAGSGRFVIQTGDGSTVYSSGPSEGSGTVYSSGGPSEVYSTGGPSDRRGSGGGSGGGGYTYTISSSQPPSQPGTPQAGEHPRPVYVVRSDSHDQSRRGSSPRVQVLRIQDALDSRRQRSPPNFDEIIQKKLLSFAKGRTPQYLFRHQPDVVTPQPQTDPSREEYIYVSHPQGSDTTEQQRQESPESGATNTLGPRKKIVRTTREEIRDLGDGQTQTIRESSEELVDDEGDDDTAKHATVPPDVIPVHSTPVIHADNNMDTWKSTSSVDSGTGSGDRNIFNKFRFKFDSIGNFGRSDSRESTASREALRFEDFDDMVGRISQLKVPQIKGMPQPAAVPDPVPVPDPSPAGDICPYCKNANPDCEYTCHHKCRENVALDCAGVSTSAEPKVGERVSRKRTETSLSSTDQSQADDADSGYHTASSTLQSRAARGAKRAPGEWTLTREDLRRNIERFNNNNHGLIMSLQSDMNTFQGFIRVHMNLIRPINMSLSTRPQSIYDVMGQEEEDPQPNDVNQITSFYLPKDTTKVIHINSDTTTQEVIQALLCKFKITDNPRKFALYEKCEDGNKSTMRRLEEDEMPLPLCLLWTKEGVNGLDQRRFVLQENDTGEIMWEAFSLPELENFLKILNREEEEYVDQVRGKYRMLKVHMERRLKELAPPETSLTDDKRTPVFV